MQAIIVGLSQELSLLDGETTNSIVIELPNGTYVRALLSDDATVEVTKAFVQSGVPAATVAAQRAAVAPPPPAVTPTPAATQQGESAHPALSFGAPALDRQYSPVVLSDEPDDHGPDGQVFGGDYADGDAMSAIGQQLQQAEASLARAVGDAGDMDKAGLAAAAARLRQGQAMPMPDWGDAAPTAPQARRKLRVSTDNMGNPVLQGSNLVDTSLLIGGNAEEGDVGQL